MSNNPKLFNSVLAQIKNGTIVTIDLNNIGLTDSDIAELVNALLTNTSVNYLNLNGGTYGIAGLQDIIRLLKANTPIGYIALGDINLGDSGAALIAATLKDNYTLFAIALNSNNIGPIGAGALIDAIAQHPRLTHVQLADNPIGDGSAIRLASLPNMTTLVLNSCQLTPVGTQGIFEAMQVYKNILDLRLGGAQFNAAGLAVLSAALREGSPLRSLFLTYCNLGNMIAYTIAPYLTRNSGLVYLHLTGNGIDDAGATALIQAVPGSSLISLMIDENNINSANMAQINALVNNNLPYPEITIFPITIAQGGEATLNPGNLQLIRSNSTAVYYSVVETFHCKFLNGVSGMPVDEFSHAELLAGHIKMVQDGSPITPAWTIKVAEGGDYTAPYRGVVRFVPFVGNLTLTNDNIEVIPNKTTSVNLRNLSCFIGNSTVPAPAIMFKAKVTNGYFQYINGQFTDTFSQRDIILNLLQFVSNSTVAPNISIQLSVGRYNSNFQPVTVQSIPLSSTTTIMPFTTITSPSTSLAPTAAPTESSSWNIGREVGVSLAAGFIGAFIFWLLSTWLLKRRAQPPVDAAPLAEVRNPRIELQHLLGRVQSIMQANGWTPPADPAPLAYEQLQVPAALLGPDYLQNRSVPPPQHGGALANPAYQPGTHLEGVIVPNPVYDLGARQCLPADFERLQQETKIV